MSKPRDWRPFGRLPGTVRFTWNAHKYTPSNCHTTCVCVCGSYSDWSSASRCAMLLVASLFPVAEQKTHAHTHTQFARARSQATQSSGHTHRHARDDIRPQRHTRESFTARVRRGNDGRRVSLAEPNNGQMRQRAHLVRNIPGQNTYENYLREFPSECVCSAPHRH